MTQEELRCANYRHLISPIIYNDEQWAPLSLYNIAEGYWISTYGRIYSEKTNCLLQGHIVENGYVVVTLRTFDGGRIYAHIHRMMMLTFCPIPNAELFVVNHKDGIKMHNYLFNLEWTTQKGNVEHAFETGLRGVGENSSHAIFTDDQIEHVCKCMQNGYNLVQLSKEVFDTTPNSQIRTLCSNIYNRKFWTHISYKYAVENYKRDYIFSIPQIEDISKILAKNINCNTHDILSLIGILNYTNDEYEIYNRAIRNIRQKKNFRHISSKYF